MSSPFISNSALVAIGMNIAMSYTSLTHLMSVGKKGRATSMITLLALGIASQCALRLVAIWYTQNGWDVLVGVTSSFFPFHDALNKGLILQLSYERLIAALHKNLHFQRIHFFLLFCVVALEVSRGVITNYMLSTVGWSQKAWASTDQSFVSTSIFRANFVIYTVVLTFYESYFLLQFYRKTKMFYDNKALFKNYLLIAFQLAVSFSIDVAKSVTVQPSLVAVADMAYLPYAIKLVIFVEYFDFLENVFKSMKGASTKSTTSHLQNKSAENNSVSVLKADGAAVPGQESVLSLTSKGKASNAAII